MKNAIEKRQQTVFKSNQLVVEGRFNLSLQEQRILLYLIARIQKDDTEFKPVELPLIDFFEIAGLEPTNYTYLKQTIKHLADSSFWLENEGESELKRWLSSDPPPKIIKGGIVRLCLSNSMRPFLLELHSRFTAYQLQWVLLFRHKFSIRLYEYLVCRHYDKDIDYSFRISFDELRAVVGAEKYTEFRSFHQRVLLPSVNEINRYTDKLVSYELVKVRNKVVAIDFTIRPQPVSVCLEHDKMINSALGYDKNQLSFFEWDFYEKQSN